MDTSNIFYEFTNRESKSMVDYRDRSIPIESSILNAFKKMDAIDKKLLIVLKNDKFAGLLSAGDIQRALVRNFSLDSHLSEIMRDRFVIGNEDESVEDIKQNMLRNRIEIYPILSNDGEILNLYFWEDLFDEDKPKKKIGIPVVIMAGGLGTRLRPLTYVLPKPLIPCGKKTMLEEIFDRFSVYGCTDFYVSVNYKAELIRYYINELRLPFNIGFFIETKPMGTAGSLSLLTGRIKSTFFVTNCDILIEQDYSEIIDYHRENNNEITVVAALKHLPIPYGTIVSGENGKLVQLQEKPELTLKINSGMYVLEPHILDEIPTNEFFHITQLIEQVNSRGGRIGVFPVSEKSWKDLGDWKEYVKHSI